jgi:chemotaxis response regulator CheB
VQKVAVWLDDYAVQALPGVELALGRSSATVMRSFTRLPNPATVTQLREYQQVTVLGGRDFADVVKRVEMGTASLSVPIIAVLPPSERMGDRLRGPGVVDVLEHGLRDAARRILLMSRVPIVSGRPRGEAHAWAPAPQSRVSSTGSPTTSTGSPTKHVLAIASSTGGCWVLADLLRSLAPQWNGPVLVAQHLEAEFVGFFGEWLQGTTGWSTEVVQVQTVLRERTVYLAAGGQDLCAVGPDSVAPSACSSRFIPSADRLFRTAARWFGEAVTGLVLSGMGADGAQGLAEIVGRGGRAVCQLPSSAIVASMPESALKLVPGAFTAPPERLASALLAGANAALFP